MSDPYDLLAEKIRQLPEEPGVYLFKDARGKGYAEEATRLWIEYGFRVLGIDKIYVSTLQTHLRNIKLNEEIGFRVEGLLREEVLLDGRRLDVLRMGLCRRQFQAGELQQGP